MLEHLKPWAAMVKVTRVAGSGNGESLDQQLLAAARSCGLRAAALELVDEQIAAFDAVPLDSQVAILQHALAHRDALAATIDPTVDAWLHGDLAGLDRITRRAVDAFPGLALHYRRLAKHLIDDRTKLMHYRLFMPLREGRVFTAIGATHPHGVRGLLTMLERDGYRVTWIR